jgi:2-amino-4-hydroxy-6-hydroxymethyldihydropteridine diphosphokinase
MSEAEVRRAFLALGSNLGDRLAILQAAVDGLATTPGVRLTSVSRVYETDPVGPAQPDYLNAVAALETTLSPRALLEAGQRLEKGAHRERRERWGPRTLDVDVLWVDGIVVDEPDLHVPHPRMRERLFVLVPLADVAPDLVADELLGPWREDPNSVRPTDHTLLVPSRSADLEP